MQLGLLERNYRTNAKGMNTNINNINVLQNKWIITFIALIMLFVFVAPTYSQFTSLYTMNGGAGDGYIPDGNLVTDGTYLYGTNNNDFFGGNGTVFRLNIDGTGFTKLHQFSGSGDEKQPSRLILIGSTLYGVANFNFGNGIIYKINTDGTGYSVIFQFDGPNYGKNPIAKLIYHNTQIYGVTFMGGINNSGVIFKINPDGTGFTKIYESVSWLLEGINYNDFTILGSTIYVSAGYGGACSCGNGGTIFKINTDGTGYQTLVDFNISNPSLGTYPNFVTIIDNKIFGFTESGLTNNIGSVFSFNIDGTNLTRLQVRGGSNPTIDFLMGYNNNGENVIIGNSQGGTYGQGYFFWMNTDGSNFNVMNQTQTLNNGIFRGTMLNYNNVIYGNLSNGGAVVGEIYKYIIPTVPTVTTNNTTNITFNSAIINGAVTGTGNANVTQRGIVWSTLPNPTIESYDGIYTNGSGLGNISTAINGLNSNTKYYVRAYATNFVGTSYGNNQTFITTASPEDFAPNNGDGNGDGILDSRQRDVHSILNPQTNRYITIISLDGFDIQNISLENIINDGTYYYPGALAKFTVSATNANIKIIYHGFESLKGFEFIKKNSHGNYFKFNSAEFSSEFVKNVKVATVKLRLTDGGPEDYDGVVNGSITDPGGPVILASNANIPTLSEWARILLISLIILLGIWKIRKYV